MEIILNDYHKKVTMEKMKSVAYWHKCIAISVWNGDAVIQHPAISITFERYYSKLFPTQFCLTRNNS